MIGSITLPRTIDRIQATASYAGAAILGGSLTGAGVGAFGSLLEQANWGALTVVLPILGLLLFTLREAGLRWIPVPSRNWAVPAAWVTGSPLQQGAIWGSFLGVGFLTHQPYPIFHAAMLCVLFVSDPLYGAFAGAAFAAMRVAPALKASCLGGSEVRAMSVSFFASIRLVHAVSGPVLAFAASTTIVDALMNAG